MTEATDLNKKYPFLPEIDFFVWQGEPKSPAWEVQGLNNWLPEQFMNGPCGVLAVYTAFLISLAKEFSSNDKSDAANGLVVKPHKDLNIENLKNILNNNGSTPNPTSNPVNLNHALATAPLPDELVAHAIAFLIIQSAGKGNFAFQPNEDGTMSATCSTLVCTQLEPEPVFVEVPAAIRMSLAGKTNEEVHLAFIESLRDKILSEKDKLLMPFQSPGGCLSLVYSLIASRGLDSVREDMGENIMEPLISGPFALCSSELMCLLMRGNASAKGFSDSEWPKFQNFAGMLSSMEIETGVPVADCLKKPRNDVWVLHGGDHFTVMWKDSDDLFLHYNGLAPAGPRLHVLKITSDPANPENKPLGPSKYIKPEVGEVEDVVQSDKSADSSGKDYTKWKFECALALVNEGVKDGDAVRDLESDPITIFDLASNRPDPSNPWRCRACYETRFQTMCFGQNEPGTTTCQHCGKSMDAAGWTIWLEFDKLPNKMQRRMRLRHAPKIIAVLETKWPNGSVELEKDGAPGV